MSTSTLTPVGELAVHNPGASRVFHRHHIDYCCGGKRTLHEACATAGVKPEAILAEIAAELKKPHDSDWSVSPLDELVDYILVHFHEPLKEELPRLVGMAHRVAHVHGHKAPNMRILAEAVEQFADETDEHIQKEEQILFPWIRAGNGSSAGMPIQQLHRDHDSHGERLKEMRRLCDNYVPPADACGTWRALYLGLEALEADLMEHIHLENNVLFPRALAE